MWHPPTVLVVDDNKKHLTAIVDNIRALGAIALPVHYDATLSNSGIVPKDFSRVRILFMDLNLLSNASRSAPKQAFSHLISILDEVISPDGGPYVLVMWTTESTKIEDLRNFLDEPGRFQKLYAKPAAVLCLNKHDHISLESGEERSGIATGLRTEISTQLEQSKSLSALLAWETSVQTQTAAVLNLVAELARFNSPAVADSEIGLVLKALADAAVGKGNASADASMALTTMLGALLSDRLLHSSPNWTGSFPNSGKAKFLSQPNAVAKVNTALHIERQSRPSQWGSVITVSPASRAGKRILGVAGFQSSTFEDFLAKEFSIDTGSHADCHLKLIRVGAACDLAQRKPGPDTYLVAIEIPHNFAPTSDFKHRTPAIWTTPEFLVERGKQEVVVALHVHRRMTWVEKTPKIARKQDYRLRTELQTVLVSEYGAYLARPGFIAVHK